ncbi:DUF742 domain-containing protein [Streptomyces sp. NPDC017993]|uniref:DUF742 domain-containing protein n=1 Tax=Streptomyces sp. NPDC017993 TaxID=3365027 RepID=UPI0037A247BE
MAQDRRWYDGEAGPVVRPYAAIGGHTGPDPAARLDVIALVSARPPAPEESSADECELGPEHRTLLALCRAGTRSVAELAAAAELPVTVVRVLLGDLLCSGQVRVRLPVPPAQLSGEWFLREVIHGLRSL